MAEYIEREALIQHMQECKDENAFTLMATGYAYSFIEVAPTADVVEVVRCKKCEHYNTSCCADGFGWCEKHNRGEMDDDFCSHGERRSDNG